MIGRVGGSRDALREIQNVQTILKGMPFSGEFVVHKWIILKPLL